jgi:hypothetical protein
MSNTYSYKPPLGLDIRVKKPGKKGEPVKKKAEPCAWPECELKGEHPAPKSPESREYQHFCKEHIRTFNKSWNFFKGMNNDEVKQFMAESHTGHRPTWKMGTAKKKSVKDTGPNFQATAEGISAEGIQDPHNLFDTTAAAVKAKKNSLTKPQKVALETLDLDAHATMVDIKLKYKELAKKYHPDTNGGDTAAVERLKHVIKAYNTLKNAGFPEK